MPTPARVTLVLGGSACYLGLAILGWGGFAAFFSHDALTGLAIVLLVVSIASCFAGGSISQGEREDKGNRWVLAVFSVLGLLNGWLPAYTDRNEIWTLDGDTLRWVGVALFLVSAALRLWPVYVLGDRFSGLVAIQPGHRLLTTGIYSVIRHPSYLRALLNSLGWSLAFRSGAGVLITALLLPAILARIAAEERLLRDQFGTEYDAWRARTPARLIPGIW